MKNNKNRTVSLVLGSGGAKGLAHIGVIRFLEEQGFIIESISGSSIGALVGGMYAAGQLDTYEKWVRSISKFDLMTLMDISWDKGGWIKGDKIINSLTKLVGRQNIEDLPIKYTAITTDIDNEKEIWINNGDLFTAIRASISIPMIFAPYQFKGKRVIDGGILNPVPIAPTFSDHTDFTIAVNLGGAPEYRNKILSRKKQSDINLSPFKTKIHNFVTSFTKNKKPEHLNFDAYDVANSAIDAMQAQIARHRLAASPPDIIIDIPRNACATMDFHKADKLIALGYSKAKLAFENSEIK